MECCVRSHRIFIIGTRTAKGSHMGPDKLSPEATLEFIREYSNQLSSTTDKDKLYRVCLSQTKEKLQLDYHSLFFLDSSGKNLIIGATEGLPENMVGTYILKRGHGLPNYVLKTGKTETVVDFKNEKRFTVTSLPADMDICSAIAAPMMISQKIIGVMIGHTRKVREFSGEEKLLYQILANQAAFAINNATHIDSLYRSEKKRENQIKELKIEKEISRERSDEFESIFTNIMTGVVLLKGGRYLARCNTKFAEMFGYSEPDTVIGMSAEMLHLDKQNYKEFGRLYYAKLVEGKSVHTEYTLKKSDGSPILCRLSGRAVDQGSPPDLTRGFVWVLDDISKRKEMEEEILQARKLESIGILAGGIGHDFNNILSAILGNLGLAQRLLEPDNKIQDLVGSALEAATKAKDLTAKLLFFTRRDSHAVGSVRLKDLLEEVNFEKYLGDNVEFVTHVQHDLFSIKIMPDHLRVILQNLLHNANGCMPGGGKVVLRGSNLHLTDGDHHGGKSGRFVKITVEDNGYGIKKEILDNIFDPYFTTKNRDSSKGIGLGLAIVHSIIKKNHGNISVLSDKEKGTVFTVTLPAAHLDIPGMKSTVILEE